MRTRDSLDQEELDLIRICNEIHERIRQLVKILEQTSNKEVQKELVEEILAWNLRKYKALDDLNNWRAEND